MAATMTAGPAVRRPFGVTPIWIRRARLASGLILFAFIATHLANHALGNLSLDGMTRGSALFRALWRSLPGTVLLYGALAGHLGLGLWALYRRRLVGWRRGDWLQLALGLVVPVLLAQHVIVTRLGYTLFGLRLDYPQVLFTLWVQNPWRGAQQMALLLVAWGHGCIGMYYWLRLRAGFARVAPLLLALAVLLPAVAALGFVQGGREVDRLRAQPDWQAAMLAPPRMPGPDQAEQLGGLFQLAMAGYIALLALVVSGRVARGLAERRRGQVRLLFPGGRVVRVALGTNILDAARAACIPHASICGGRGRCSTCRIKITRGLDGLPAPDRGEAQVLRRIGADPDVRLACQLAPRHDVGFVSLVPPPAGLDPDGRDRSGRAGAGNDGRERTVAILFVDMRGSTTIAERSLPYDVVFLFNRYFEAIGSAVIEAGGLPNQFIGDGVMALFGIEDGAQAGCRQALAATRAIQRNIAALNRNLAGQLPVPVRIGMGLHAGTAIVGRMGYQSFVTTTAVGDPVNVAARLQELSKQYQAQLIVSDVVADFAGLSLAGFDQHDIQVRGRSEPLAIRVVPDLDQLPAVPGEG